MCRRIESENFLNENSVLLKCRQDAVKIMTVRRHSSLFRVKILEFIVMILQQVTI